MFMGLMITSSLQADTVPIVENVTELYVATFNRAPDSSGLDYWVDSSGLYLEQVSQSFFDQPETQTLYPPGTSAYDFVWSVYDNLFNRTPDSGGLTYWAEELQSGRIHRSVFILAVINGAQNTEEYGNDATILENKTMVGLSFSSAGLDDVKDAEDIMVGITDDDATVTSALDRYDIECEDGSYPPSCAYAPPASQSTEASFYRAFDGKDYYTKSDGGKVDFSLNLSTMSSDGKVVAFYGNTYFDYTSHYTLFIHNFESTAEPVEVPLLARTGAFNTNAGMTSNADGSRIFFFATDTENGFQELYMVNGLTGELTAIFHTSSTIENPYDIATDANGDYLYFNESDNGDRGHLWRVAASAGAIPTIVINQGTVNHPYGGHARFIDGFGVSDDGQTIAFFVEGRIETDGSSIRGGTEVFVKTASGTRWLTNDPDANSRYNLVLSGDGSTIVFSQNTYNWVVTTPDAAVNSQVHIEDGYGSCGDRASITTDGSTFLGKSTKNGVSDCHAYLIKTDGSGREMIDSYSGRLGSIALLNLSGDGKRVFFKNRKYVSPDGWYNMTTGTFDRSLWTNKVPRITSVNYPSDMFTKLENDERFDISIGVSDPQGDGSIDDVDRTVFLPSGYEARGAAGPISIGTSFNQIDANLYGTYGERGSDWPSNDPVRVRYEVEDEDGNVGYADTVISPM